MQEGGLSTVRVLGRYAVNRAVVAAEPRIVEHRAELVETAAELVEGGDAGGGIRSRGRGRGVGRLAFLFASPESGI